MVFFLKYESKNFHDQSNLKQKSPKHQQVLKPIKSSMFLEIFPFHLIFNDDLKIVSVGRSLENSLSYALGSQVTDIFSLSFPEIPFTWKDVSIHLSIQKTCKISLFILKMMDHRNNMFELESIESLNIKGDEDRFINLIKMEKRKCMVKL